MLPSHYPIANLSELEVFAARCAKHAKPGDVFALEGDLGAGKTTFARAFIRSLLADKTIDIPSPTFSLVQLYDAPQFTIWHFDLYRLEQPSEIAELGLEEALDTGVCLIEWPRLAEPFLPPSTTWLEIQFGKNPNERYIDIQGAR